MTDLYAGINPNWVDIERYGRYLKLRAAASHAVAVQVNEEVRDALLAGTQRAAAETQKTGKEAEAVEIS